jgi:hypothetical protein
MELALWRPNKTLGAAGTNSAGGVAAPDFGALLSGINSPVQGLTEEQKNVMKSRLVAQGKTGLRNVLENLGSALGQSSPAFALNAARMQQGVGSNVAAKMADVDVAEADKARAAELARRGQMLDFGSLLNQQYGIEKGAETSRYGIDKNLESNRLSQLMALWQQMPQMRKGLTSSPGMNDAPINPDYLKWQKLAQMLGGGSLTGR